MRIKFGVLSIDCRIERRTDGSLYLEKPPRVYFYPEHLGGIVAAALKAYHKAQDQRVNIT